MRPVARNLVVGLLLVLGLMLALGAVPGLLRSGAPYYVTATVTEAEGQTVPADALTPRRYPFVTGALEAADNGGRSDPYWRGPIGIKGAFTHAPFDEFAALRHQYPNATTGDAVLVRSNGTTYRMTIVQEGST